MRRDLQEILFVGIEKVVVALRQSDGAEQKRRVAAAAAAGAA